MSSLVYILATSTPSPNSSIAQREPKHVKSSRKARLEAIEVLKVKAENASPKALMLATYHTTIIHRPYCFLVSEYRVLVSEELLCFGNSLLGYFSVLNAD